MEVNSPVKRSRENDDVESPTTKKSKSLDFGVSKKILAEVEDQPYRQQ